VAVIERTGREQDQGDQSGDRTTKVAADSPCCDQSDYSYERAHEPARFKKIERKNLGGKRGRHVEAAAIFVEIDEGEGALVGEARAVELEQQIAILGMGVVVPAEPIVAEGHQRDDRDDYDNANRNPVGNCNCRPGARKWQR
jgi:hypothetical protein